MEWRWDVVNFASKLLFSHFRKSQPWKRSLTTTTLTIDPNNIDDVMSLLLPKQHNLDGQHVRCDQPLRLPRSPYQWWWGCVKCAETEVRSVTLSGRCGAPEQTIAWFRRPDSFKLVVRLWDRPHTLRLAPIKINVKIYISSVYLLIKFQWENAENYIW